MFRVTLLPAGEGDSILVEYGGDALDPVVRHILIDGGTSPSAKAVRARLDQLPTGADGRRRLELFTVTHVDTDHIGGVLRLLSGAGAKDLDVGEFWFNERRHLQPVSILGAVDGEVLGSFLDALGWPSNPRFQPADKPKGNFPVMVPDAPAAEPDRPPPTFELPGKLSLTLLSPGPTQVVNLRTAWDTELAEKHLDPNDPDFAEKLSEAMHRKGVQPPSMLGSEDDMTVDDLADTPFVEDPSAANGSSIAFLLERGERSVLLTGDAVPSALLPSIRRLNKARKQTTLTVDAVKLPHHGSKNNVSTDLVELLRSPRWLVSTNGSKHDHPDLAAMARVVRANQGRGIRLGFNYPKGTHEHADRWDDPQTRDDFGYSTRYAPDHTGLVVDLDDPDS